MFNVSALLLDDALLKCVVTSGQIEGERGVPLPFLEGERSGGPGGWTCRKWKTDNVTSKGSAVDMPECWTQYQLIEKTKTSPWLIVRNIKLGCKTCRNVKSIKTLQSTD